MLKAKLLPQDGSSRSSRETHVGAAPPPASLRSATAARRMLPLVTALLLATPLLLQGCRPSKAAPSHVLKPIEERRARATIEQALLNQRQQPGPGRVIQLSNKQPLTEDMHLRGSRYGIAYLTAEEATKAGAAIPPFDAASQRLRLIRGSADEVVLVLYEQAYQYDAGNAHSTTAVTAERRLKRDVEDFVMHMVRQEKTK